MSAVPKSPRRRTVLVAICASALLTGLGVWQYAPLRAAQHANRLASAPADMRETLRADLVAMGDHAVDPLVGLLDRDDDGLCEIAGDILLDVVNGLPAERKRAAGLRARDSFGKNSVGGQAAVLVLLSRLVAEDPTLIEEIRPLIASGSKATSPQVRAAAVRLMSQPGVAKEEEIRILLGDGAPQVRRASLLGLAGFGENPTTGPDEFFPLLHDSDPENRRLAELILRGRGLRTADIRLARRFTHPDPSERLRLLLDVQTDDGVNTASLLDRLATDAVPAVRVAAVRSAAENGIDLGDRVREMSREDQSESVRWLAGHYGRWMESTK